jgi:penicillin amidase
MPACRKTGSWRETLRVIRNLLVGIAILIAILVLVPAGVLGGIIAWLKLSPPATSGQVSLPGLAQPVDLVWDHNAVPHIFAGSLRDAYRTLGWAHARDRLWQMETQRRIGQGRLAELVGSLGLAFDKEMRVLGVYRLAEANYAALDPEAKADVDAYVAGVNAYLEHPAAPLPIEFQLLHVTPEPWRPADTLVWGRLMALQLSGNYREEALRAELVRTLPPDIFKLLFPDSAPAGPMTLGALGGIDWRRFTANLPPVLGPDHASNEWVVDGTLTRSGKPLLANDPHLGLSAPILWYLARIVTPEGSVAGVTFPGVPYTILGHNDRVAWGATTTGGDVQDLFVEDVLPNDPTRYKTPDGDAAFTSRDEIIKVRFGQDVHLTVRASRHGPILSDIEPELATAVGPDKAVALSFIGLDPDDTTVLAFRGIDRARDWPSFQAALKLWISPEQNIVYADLDGHIAFTSVGELPIRKRPTDDFPAPGASGVADWIGVSQFSQLPQAVDPPSHRFINANNRVVPADYPLYITHAYSDDPFRAERITAMLDDRTGLTAEDFGHMQIDVKEQDADLLMPRLRVAEPKTEAGRRAIDLLRAWNRTMPVDRAEPLIYAAWVARLKETLIGRTLAADSTGARAFGFGFSPFLLVRLLDREGDAAPGILGGTLDDTMAALEKIYGADFSQWRWGAAHPAALTSQLFGTVPVIGRLFDVGLPAPGGQETVDRAGYGGADLLHFRDVHGPGYRGVFDLADLDASRFIIATGQSGNPFSPHYGDLAERWRDGGAITLAGTADDVAAKGIGRQRFVP